LGGGEKVGRTTWIDGLVLAAVVGHIIKKHNHSQDEERKKELD